MAARAKPPIHFQCFTAIHTIVATTVRKTISSGHFITSQFIPLWIIDVVMAPVYQSAPTIIAANASTAMMSRSLSVVVLLVSCFGLFNAGVGSDFVTVSDAGASETVVVEAGGVGVVTAEVLGLDLFGVLRLASASVPTERIPKVATISRTPLIISVLSPIVIL